MKIWLLLLAMAAGEFSFAQPTFSIATDGSVLRNFSPQQKFWAAGQTVQMQFHFSPTQSAYTWVDYYTEGKFKNNFTASAKSFATSPQQIAYTATGYLTFRQISVGWKHYFKGSYNTTKDVNIYGLAGFGFLFAKARNNSSVPIDTIRYTVRPVIGEGNIKKLTLDLGAGGELHLGGNFYAYADVRTWLPASSSPSPFLHNQRNMPLPVMLCAGLRLLFDFSY